ncbi:MAG: FAD-linked oxidase C-terminal domain-containing protein [Thermoactinomyces sp.]
MIYQLEQIVGKKYCRTDQEARLTHSYDATPLFQSWPHAVVYPQTTEQVQAIMKVAHIYKVPVISRGSGTNLSASTVPVQGGIVMVFTRMNKILEIDEKNLTVTLQPGVITRQLHDAVEARSLFYPPDPGSMSISTIGGNIAQGAGGLRGLKYGTTTDYVLGLEAVLANGEVIRTGGKLTKNVSGYDVTRLLVGSEGTLAIITEATLKLLPKPPFQQTMAAFFSDLDAAAEAVSAIIAARIIPCTLEFMDQGTMQVVEEYANIGLPVDQKAMLILEQDGAKEVVEKDLAHMEQICRSLNATGIRIAKTRKERIQILEARRTALSALARATPTTILEDATVPRASIPAMVRKITEIAERYNVRICTFGHAGDGNLHPTCMTDARNKSEIARVEKAFAEIFHAALELGGTITGEHGVGLSKMPYMEQQWRKAGINLLSRIKDAFDPHHLLNPGKIFYPPEEGKQCQNQPPQL